MGRDKYLYLSSEDSVDYFGKNSPSNFFVKLPHSFKLPGFWECALVQFQYASAFFSETPKDFFICTDIISESFMKDSKPPVLRRVYNSYSQGATTDVVESEIINLFYLPVIKEYIDVIHVYIMDENKKPVVFSKGPSLVTLHLRNIRGF